jgi:hypothetical protein
MFILLVYITAWNFHTRPVMRTCFRFLVVKFVPYCQIYMNFFKEGLPIANSYMRKAFLIYEEMRKYLVIFEEAAP